MNSFWGIPRNNCVYSGSIKQVEVLQPCKLDLRVKGKLRVKVHATSNLPKADEA